MGADRKGRAFRRDGEPHREKRRDDQKACKGQPRPKESEREKEMIVNLFYYDSKNNYILDKSVEVFDKV